MSDSDIKQLIKKSVAFRYKRDWKQFHNPKDLTRWLRPEYQNLEYKHSGGSRQQTGQQQEIVDPQDLRTSTIAVQTSAKLAWLYVAHSGKRTRERIEDI